MTDHAREMVKIEATYLAGAEANLESAKGRQLTGSAWKTVQDDEGDRLRAIMARHRVYDRDMLKSLPQNRRVAVHGYKRRWGIWKVPTGVAVASVLSPLEDLVDPNGVATAPVDLPELADHLRKIASDRSVPYVVGVCSPTGFTERARRAKLDMPHLTLVLVEPAEGGGWKTGSANEELPPEVLALFDPERHSDKLERARRVIEERSSELLTGGMSSIGLAQELSMPQHVVVKAMDQVSARDRELRISRQPDDVILYRGVAARSSEKTSMNVVDRIRQLFAKEGDETEKINVLSERRARLAQRRDRLYGDIAKLEGREQELLQQGKDSQSAVTRRRLAAQLAQLRKDIGRQNTTANMLNQQINILSTDIHNLTLIQQGNIAQLPDTEELTENAVKAEEMLETLKVDADMVGSLETGMSELSTSDEELAILKEFESVEAKPAEELKADAGKAAPSRAAPEKRKEEAAPRTASVTPPEPQEPESRRRADPETT